jgi:hypothetical protein
MFLLVVSSVDCGIGVQGGASPKPGPDGVIEITDRGRAPNLQGNIGEFRGKKIRLSGMMKMGTFDPFAPPKDFTLRTTNGGEEIHLDVPESLRNSFKVGGRNLGITDVIVVEFLCKEGSLTDGNELASVKLH